MEIKDKIKQVIKKVVRDLSLAEITVQLDHPTDENHGDYSSNIAMAIFSNSKFKIQNSKFRTPLDLAKKIVTLLNTKYLIHNTSRIETVVPGFINFYLSKEYLVDQLKKIAEEKEQFGAGETLKGKKIMVEYTDPNPFKEFHIGHLYSNSVGESLCRLFESQGALVWRVNYQGDIGLHVAKALWGMISLARPGLARLEAKNLEGRVKLIGQAYAQGSKAYEEDEDAKKEINKLNKKIYEKTDQQINDMYEKGRTWTLEYFEIIYKRLGTTFKRYYFESEAGPIGLQFVKDHIKDGVFKESDGAIIFEGEKYGLHNRVFINSLGLPTYEAKDLGLPPTKYKDFPYDQSIIITAQEQSGYFEVVFKALSLINPDLAAKTEHIAHGVVRLPEGKMSSRTGNIITGEWLLDEAKRRIQEEYKQMDSETAEKVAVGAVKYALLKSGIGRDISFDFDESISLEGNSGPYLQYTYARTQSVLAKAKSKKRRAKNSLTRPGLARLEAEELSTLRTIHRFSEVVGEATEKLSPNFLCTYLFDLSQKFNLFYQRHQILGDIGEVRDFRLALTAGVGQVIKNGLHLLGIAAPERM